MPPRRRCSTLRGCHSEQQKQPLAGARERVIGGMSGSSFALITIINKVVEEGAVLIVIAFNYSVCRQSGQK